MSQYPFSNVIAWKVRKKKKKKETKKKTEKELTLLASSGKKRSDKRVTDYRDQPVYYKYFL